MDSLKIGVNAVVDRKADLFLAETRKLWEPILQRPLSDEDCENLSAQFVDFINFLGNSSEKKCSTAEAEQSQKAEI